MSEPPPNAVATGLPDDIRIRLQALIEAGAIDEKFELTEEGLSLEEAIRPLVLELDHRIMPRVYKTYSACSAVAVVAFVGDVTRMVEDDLDHALGRLRHFPDRPWEDRRGQMPLVFAPLLVLCLLRQAKIRNKIVEHGGALTITPF